MEFHQCIRESLQKMNDDARRYGDEEARIKQRVKLESQKHQSKSLDSVNGAVRKEIDSLPKKKPWVADRKNRYKLEAAADLLLFYSKTSTFFEIKQWSTFASSPIEVYARELGNSVPKSVIDAPSRGDSLSDGIDSSRLYLADCSSDDNDGNSQSSQTSVPNARGNKKLKPSLAQFCEPDDIVTNVTVQYRGDYVLSLLLQWYSGGISLKQGLPDMLGCVMLPEMAGCWVDKEVNEVRSDIKKRCKFYSRTAYEAEIRPRLIEWLEDRHKRGNPWSEEIVRYFSAAPDDLKERRRIVGSPIIDLLITGDDSNIRQILSHMKTSEGHTEAGLKSRKSSKTAVERLQTSVDEGMPAQAVANWVQCENPDCMKWRKLPWHVDMDLLPETFYCKDNKWNQNSNSCEAPEDIWDERDAPVKDGENRIPESAFVKGGTFVFVL